MSPLVVEIACSNEQRSIALQKYSSENKSVVAVERELRTYFGIPPRNNFPDRKPVLLWINDFRACGSVLQKRDEAPRELTEL